MKPILILPPNHTEDDSAIWRAAIARGMSPLRCQRAEDYAAEIPDAASVFYYGNTLHYDRVLATGLELRAKPLDPLWVAHVSEGVFGRSVTPMTVVEFLSLPEATFFVKHVHQKWFKPQVRTPQTTFLGSSNPSDLLHVQGVVKFVDEVRCWVIDGRILTWSYYRRNERPWRGVADEDLCDDWLKLVGSVAHALPKATVIDVGLIGDRWHVIEANEPWASGIYDCDPEQCLEVILEDQKP